MASKAMARQPAVSGLFYPAEPEALRRQMKYLFEKAPRTRITGTVRGVVAPHAGYVYSGVTAAAGYGLVRGRSFETVVVISPSHREAFRGVSVYSGDAYETPLGTVRVDTAMRKQLLCACPVAASTEVGHREEHAVEVQLPFLQETLGDFMLLPIVMGEQDRSTCLELGRALGEILEGKNALVVASTDLSHYHSSRVAEAIERVAIEDVRRFDFEQLMTDLETGTTEACGGGPTVAMMAALRKLGVNHMEVVHHCNSGDVTGDTRSVVGYLSAVAWS
jgi:MEMO1 family protein